MTLLAASLYVCTALAQLPQCEKYPIQVQQDLCEWSMYSTEGGYSLIKCGLQD